MSGLKQKAKILLSIAVSGDHAYHHASVLVNGAWLRNRGDENAAYAQVLSMAERFSK